MTMIFELLNVSASDLHRSIDAMCSEVSGSPLFSKILVLVQLMLAIRDREEKVKEGQKQDGSRKQLID